jgi:hypothetical protein
LKHGIAYQNGRKPKMLDGEPELGFDPIKVDFYTKFETLAKESRVNYAKLTTVDHSFRVTFIGRVDADDFNDIAIPAVDSCWESKDK